MRALHVFLTAMCPLVILSACNEAKSDPPKPKLQQEGSGIVSVIVKKPNQELDTVQIPDDVDAVFTSDTVLKGIMIPYYASQGRTDMIDVLQRTARESVDKGTALVAHKRYSTVYLVQIK